MKLKHLIFISMLCLSLNVQAEELATVEDTSPPAPEGPLTLDQIPPLTTLPSGQSTVVPHA